MERNTVSWNWSITKHAKHTTTHTLTVIPYNSQLQIGISTRVEITTEEGILSFIHISLFRTYKGLDISIGKDKTQFGGILIRSIEVRFLTMKLKSFRMTMERFYVVPVYR